MMVLFLKALDEERQVRDFRCQIYELETAFSVLSRIVAGGNTLIEAYILDEGQRTYLPTHAFDNQDLLDPIHQLQSQWETILA